MQDLKSKLVVVLALLSAVLLVALIIVSGQQDSDEGLMVEVDGEKRLVTAEEFLALQLASQQHPIEIAKLQEEIETFKGTLAEKDELVALLEKGMEKLAAANKDASSAGGAVSLDQRRENAKKLLEEVDWEAYSAATMRWVIVMKAGLDQGKSAFETYVDLESEDQVFLNAQYMKFMKIAQELGHEKNPDGVYSDPLVESYMAPALLNEMVGDLSEDQMTELRDHALRGRSQQQRSEFAEANPLERMLLTVQSELEWAEELGSILDSQQYTRYADHSGSDPFVFAMWGMKSKLVDGGSRSTFQDTVSAHWNEQYAIGQSYHADVGTVAKRYADSVWETRTNFESEFGSSMSAADSYRMRAELLAHQIEAEQELQNLSGLDEETLARVLKGSNTLFQLGAGAGGE